MFKKTFLCFVISLFTLAAFATDDPNLPGRESNGFHTSQLSQTFSAAFAAYPKDQFSDLYEKYLGIRHKISTTATCGDWIPQVQVKSGSTLDRVLKSGVIRIGYVYHSPYEYLDAAGKLTGFEYDLANQLLPFIQKQYPKHPLKIEWKLLEYKFSGSGQETLELFDFMDKHLENDEFDVVLTGMIAMADRSVATACPDMDFYFDAFYTGKDNLDLKAVQYKDRATFIQFLVDHPGLTLVSSKGGPSEDTVNEVADEVKKAGSSVSTNTASTQELADTILKQQCHFVIGDGIALSAVALDPNFKGLNLDIDVYTGAHNYLAPFTRLDK